ncbi:unnamed protein product, partial [Scytosiphon promiscuus]
QAYYTLFDVENLRVGFACTGNGCSGGTWHGQGGFMEIEEAVSWRRCVKGESAMVVAVAVPVVSPNVGGGGRCLSACRA